MIHLTSIGMILDEDNMEFYLSGESGELYHKLDIDYRDVTDKEDISEKDMNLINYYGELYETKADYEETLYEAKKDYHKNVSIITNYYRSFKGIR